MVTRRRNIKGGTFALIIALLFAVPTARATSVSGKLIDITGAPVPATNALVRVMLLNYGSSLPRVIGSHVIANPKIDLKPDATGYFGGTLTGNDTISPSSTFYRFCVISNGSQFRCADYLVSGSTFDLDVETPISTAPTVAPPTGDTVYLRTDGGNKMSGSAIPDVDSTQGLGNSAARWEGFFDDLNLASLTSSTSNPATTGTIRLANASDKACWRNAENTADICIYLDSSNVLQLPAANVAGSMTLGGVPLAVYPGAGIPVSTGSAWGSSLTAPSGAIVGTTDTQTLSNKTLTSPVLNTSVSGSALQGTDSKLLTAGTLSGTGSTLCTDSSGGATTTGCSLGGVSVVAKVDLSGQTASISYTTIYTTPAAGFYRVSFALFQVDAASASASASLKFSQESSVITKTSVASTSVLSGVPDAGSGRFEVYADSGTAIQYAVTFSPNTAPYYFDVHVRVEKVE